MLGLIMHRFYKCRLTPNKGFLFIVAMFVADFIPAVSVFSFLS
jgi:hypothetical protein